MASSPMAGAMAQQLIQSLANRGAAGAGASPIGGGPGGPGGPPGPGGPGGPGGGPPDMTGKVSAELSDLQGADPQAIRGLLTQIKQQLVALIPHTAFRIPGVTKHVSKAMENITAAIGEADKALQTSQSAGALPIGLSAVQNAAGTAGPGV